MVLEIVLKIPGSDEIISSITEECPELDARYINGKIITVPTLKVFIADEAVEIVNPGAEKAR